MPFRLVFCILPKFFHFFSELSQLAVFRLPGIAAAVCGFAHQFDLADLSSPAHADVKHGWHTKTNQSSETNNKDDVAVWHGVILSIRA